MLPRMLVIVLDPDDPQLRDITQSSADGPTFGIVSEGLDRSGRVLEFRFRVKYDDGTISVVPAGQLVSLLVLSEDDAANLTPSEAFSKWSAEIVKRQGIVRLSEVERDFLFQMRAAAV